MSLDPAPQLFARRFLTRGKWIALAAVLLMIIGPVVYISSAPARPPRWPLVLIPLCWLPALVWDVIAKWYSLRLRRRLNASGWCLCPSCGYDLSAHSALPSETTGPRDPIPYPECGRLSRLVRVREAWREQFG